MYNTVIECFIWLLIWYSFSYKIMVRENRRRERPVDRHSGTVLHPPHNDSNRDAHACHPNTSQEVHYPPPVPREHRYEQLRKLGATPFYGTLDPAEAESWLESIERVFNLMQCTPDEKIDYAVFLL